jgi:hypothetical protein
MAAMNTIAINMKTDWALGFSDGLDFNACDPTMADVSEDAYRAGYAYAMEAITFWDIYVQEG